jgi:hypothetical protein
VAIGRVLAAIQVLDDKVASRKNFQPPGLSSGDYFECLEEFEILVVALN